MAQARGAVLALDLSLSTGWAFGRPNEKPSWGTWQLGQPDQDGDGRRFSGLAGALEDAIGVHSPDLIIYEAPLARQQTSARLLISLCGIVEMIASERGIRYCEQGAPTARKEVLGRGTFRPTEQDPRAGRVQAKATVLAWCQAEGWDVRDDNAADALVLMRYAHAIGAATRISPARTAR